MATKTKTRKKRVKRLDHPAAPAQSIAPRCKLFTVQPHQIPPLAPLKTAHLGRPVPRRGELLALGDSHTTHSWKTPAFLL